MENDKCSPGSTSPVVLEIQILLICFAFHLCYTLPPQKNGYKYSLLKNIHPKNSYEHLSVILVKWPSCTVQLAKITSDMA